MSEKHTAEAERLAELAINLLGIASGAKGLTALGVADILKAIPLTNLLSARDERDELKAQIDRLASERSTFVSLHTHGELRAELELVKAELSESTKALNEISVSGKLGEYVRENVALRSQNAALMDSIRGVANPYPADVFPMTEAEYVRAVPNESLRTAISGLLARYGWNAFKGQLYDQLRMKGISLE